MQVRNFILHKKGLMNESAISNLRGVISDFSFRHEQHVNNLFLAFFDMKERDFVVPQ